VHGVLQVVDLADGPLSLEFDAAVQAQAVAEGVVEQADLVAVLAASALHSDVVQRAAAREHWRESFVGTVAEDGTIVEGFIDLLYREDDGSLVVVDYKTDAVPTGGIGSRVRYYQPQIEAYLNGIRDATGAEARGVLLFLHPETALEEPVG
jgi:ATP-dependent helicase/nuclease subunit A